jgi:hypothetical protein
MKRSFAFVAVLLALAVPARADIDFSTLIDPANLHISGSGAFAQSGGGTDWVSLPTFNGTFSLEDISNKDVTISPFHIVIAIPNQTGVLADLISTVVTTSGLSISPGPEVILTSGSAYDALNLSGGPNSVSFVNFNKAEVALGLDPATSFGLNDFSLGALALLNKLPLDITLQGLLPAGSIIFAYGVDVGVTELYTTAFTNAGVITPFAATPEPSSFVIAGASAVGFGIYGYRRRRKSA